MLYQFKVGEIKMKYRFKNSEEAIIFGQNATKSEQSQLRKARSIFEAQYNHLKDQIQTAEHFNRRLQLATWAQFCREALEEANIN